MDENKNWVDWKNYDAYASFEYIASRKNSNTLTCSAPYTGLYIAAMSYWGNTPNINTSGQVDILANFTATTGDNESKTYIAAIVCNSGTSFTISCTIAGNYTQIAVFYFGSRYTTAILQNYTLAMDNVASSELRTDSNNHILIGVVSGVSPTITSYSCSTQESYKESSFACGTTIAESGSISMRLPSNNYGAGIIGDILVS